MYVCRYVCMYVYRYVGRYVCMYVGRYVYYVRMYAWYVYMYVCLDCHVLSCYGLEIFSKYNTKNGETNFANNF